MAYKLKHRESVPDNLKRIAHAELKEAVQHLHSKNGTASHHSVHEARKDIKKVRSLLRLVQPELGATYDKTATVLRSTGQKLSQIRDADALISALDDLRQRSDGKLPARTVAAIHGALLKNKKKVETEVGLKTLMPQLGAKLSKADGAVKGWPIHKDGFRSLEDGLERTYRRGRKALARAKKDPDRDVWHEWRKRVKDHWYHIRLLKNIWSEATEGYAQSLKELQTYLGDDLTLHLLSDHLSGSLKGSTQVEAVLQAIDAQRKELREKALLLGDVIYGPKPKVLMSGLRHLWKAWHKNSATKQKSAAGDDPSDAPAQLEVAS